MLSDVKIVYYQPISYSDDGTNINLGDTPEELFSFQAFISREDCERWLENHGYNPGDFSIVEYHDDDIEEVTLLDGNGEVIPRIEELDDIEIEDMLTDDVLFTAGSIDNLHATRQSDETEDQFMDRVYTEAHQKVSDAIETIEQSGDYNFQSYAGCPETEWYDEARDEAIRQVMRWMLEDYPYYND